MHDSAIIRLRVKHRESGGSMIRVGIIGYGLAGAVFHEPLVRACDRLDLTGVLTSREHPLRADSVDSLLNGADLVIIASPNQTHFSLAKVALESGKHVVVDKPFTVALDEADELILLAQRHQRILTVFQNRRWDADFLAVQRILRELGEVLLFEANWDRFRPEIKEGWREMPMPGSGLLSDFGPHLIDQALRLFGMPYYVEADIITQRPGAKVDDYFDISLHYGAMRACLRSSTLAASARPRFAVYGTAGSFVKHGLDPQEAQLKAGMDPRDAAFGLDTQCGTLTFGDGRSGKVPAERGQYLCFYESVAAAILDGAPVPVPAEEARNGMLLIDLARRAAQAGQRLAVPDASWMAE
jgi:scyllo-inositol 2-dehydrogenase (NADP+)